MVAPAGLPVAANVLRSSHTLRVKHNMRDNCFMPSLDCGAAAQVYVDCTLGAGGHMAAMMQQHPVSGAGGV